MVWRTCDEVGLTAGKRYWEVEILNYQSDPIEVGVTRPSPDSNY
jgi:hypothetical protein